MNSLNKAIKLAVAKGNYPIENVGFAPHFTFLLFDPDFWKALGIAMDFRNVARELHICGKMYLVIGDGFNTLFWQSVMKGEGVNYFFDQLMESYESI